MKIAYCILCHRNSNILRTTIELLSVENDIYMHVDAKSNISDFEEYADKITLVSPRVSVHWGGFSIVESVLKLLDNARRKKYDYYFLISGDDLPIKSSSNIKNFIEANLGTEFIGIDKFFDEKLLVDRLYYRQPFYDNPSHMNNKELVEEDLVFEHQTNKSFVVNEYYEQLPKLYKGVNWFAISHNFCEYIFDFIDSNQWYLNAFKYSRCSDEVFFQTLIMNSRFKKKIYKLDTADTDNEMALRYIDWKHGPEFPKKLNKDDFGKILESGALFARKFDEDIDIEDYKLTMGLA